VRKTSRLETEDTPTAGDPPVPQSERDRPLPVDPDLRAARPRRRRPAHLLRGRGDILAVIACGGALGSAARYGVAEALPHQPGTIAWSTFAVNVLGGFLLGLLMVFVIDVWPPTRYVRPFLGVGVLGGFTTFSTYMVDTQTLLDRGETATAAGYVFGTLVIGLAAVWLGIISARLLDRLRRRRHTATRTADTRNPAPTRSTR
jgi:CrcB protein